MQLNLNAAKLSSAICQAEKSMTTVLEHAGVLPGIARQIAEKITEPVWKVVKDGQDS